MTHLANGARFVGMVRCVAVSLLVALGGCSTTATVVTRDRKTYEATIVGGDREQLLLQSPWNVETVVKRRDVRDIDHPGNVIAVLGGVLAGSAALELSFFVPFCTASRGSGATACSFIYGTMGAMGAAGAGMLLWGLWTWLNSKSVVEHTAELPAVEVTTEPAQPAPPPLPAAPRPAL